MDDKSAEGAVRNAGGRLQEAVGDLTGDTLTQTKGKLNRAAGEMEQRYGDTIDRVRDFTVNQPGQALAAALGVGVLLGLFVARR